MYPISSEQSHPAFLFELGDALAGKLSVVDLAFARPSAAPAQAVRPDSRTRSGSRRRGSMRGSAPSVRSSPSLERIPIRYNIAGVGEVVDLPAGKSVAGARR